MGAIRGAQMEQLRLSLKFSLQRFWVKSCQVAEVPLTWTSRPRPGLNVSQLVYWGSIWWLESWSDPNFFSFQQYHGSIGVSTISVCTRGYLVCAQEAFRFRRWLRIWLIEAMQKQTYRNFHIFQHSLKIGMGTSWHFYRTGPFLLLPDVWKRHIYI